jgi:amidase
MPLGNPQAVDLKNLRVTFYAELPLTFDSSTLAIARKVAQRSGKEGHIGNLTVSPTPEISAIIGHTAKVLADVGMIVEEGYPSGSEQSLDLWFRLFSADGGAGLRKFLQLIGTTETSPILQGALDTWSAYAISTPEFIDWMFRWDVMRSQMLSFMNNHDVIVCPVNAYPAPLHGVSFDPYKFPAFVYPMTYNLTGWPAVVVRVGTSPEGLPIGVQVVARPWREDVALAVAQHIETVLGGWQRPPL